MISSARLPLGSLVELCRVLRLALGAGLPVRDVFQQQGRKGTETIRPIAERIGKGLERGDSLEDALEREQAVFPPLFRALVVVGEQTGHLPEVFGELERYYTLQQRLRRQFLAQSVKPAMQFVVAVLIIAFMMWMLGEIAARNDVPPIDPLGLGLTGTRGAILFLTGVVSLIAGLFGVYLLAVRAGRGPTIDARLLRLPAIGPCLRALALTRFCLALRLTLGGGMPIVHALALSLRATGNAAFADCIPQVQRQLRGGQELTVAVRGTGLFPDDFQKILAVAEASGQVPEVMHRQAERYQEEAERRLTFLTRAASFLLWALVATLIVIAIFRIFIHTYLAAISGF